MPELFVVSVALIISDTKVREQQFQNVALSMLSKLLPISICCACPLM